MRAYAIAVILAVVLFFGCSGKETEVSEMLEVKSVFGNGEKIPAKYTCEGEDVSPPLILEGVDKNAVSIAIIVDDPDAPIGVFTHWVAWNIPPVSEIPENVPKADTLSSPIKIVQGKNDFGKIGYNGPCPPRGHGVHHYHFKVYVLDTTFDLKLGSSKRDLENAMKGHILQKGELVGIYERK